MDEADWEHTPPGAVPLDLALHPILVVRLLVQHYQYLTLLKLQLVIVVRVAIVQRPTTPVAAHKRVDL